MRLRFLPLLPLGMAACHVVVGLSDLAYDLEESQGSGGSGGIIGDGGEAGGGTGGTGGAGGGIPADCGDGIVNDDEQCDDEGESATCDIDCSQVVCGDGRVNVTAGEQCEDLNLVDDDGCDASCQIEGSCSLPLAFGLTTDSNGVQSGSAVSRLSGVSLLASDECDGTTTGAGSERIFEITLVAATNLQIELVPAFDGILRLMTSVCDTTSEIAEFGQIDGCSDRGGSGAIERLSYPGLAAGTYYVAVDGATDTDVGLFTLSMSTFGGTNCSDILTEFPGLANGVYLIDPDGPGGTLPFAAFCDMASDGGGWTLAARFSNSDPDNWTFQEAQWWYTRENPVGATTDTGPNADMIGAAFWSLPARELKFTRSDDLGNASLLVTTGNCLDGASFREFLVESGDYTLAPWAVSTVKVDKTCNALVAAGATATKGFALATCTPTTLAMENTVSFWAGSNNGRGSVIMIGGANPGLACGQPDHGFGVSTWSGFGDEGGTEMIGDFGDNANAVNTLDPGYAINLFVK